MDDDYGDREHFGREGQEEHGRPTLAQWARAQAVQALGAAGTDLDFGDPMFIDRVHGIAQLILGV